MPAIHLEKQEANGETFYQNKGGSVDFSLHIVNAVSFRFEVRGNINPMMHMMLQKPLKKLLEDFSTKLSQRYS